jgi:hypothetical protein
VIERCAAAGVPEDKITCERDAFAFESPVPPSEFLEAFRNYYGPTMNAFDAAEMNGRAEDLHRELAALFNEQNQSANDDTTSITATFLRVTVEV